MKSHDNYSGAQTMNSSYIQQATRINQKLKQVRMRNIKCFGSAGHQFVLNWPLSERSVRAFEIRQGVELPRSYRTFLCSVGNGGAGPHYGLRKLPARRSDIAIFDHNLKQTPTNMLSLSCPLHPKISREDNWREQFSGCVSPYQGIMVIGDQGCTYVTGLIVTGREAGRVVYLDESRGGEAPYVMDEPDFLGWYERWLDDLLSGVDTTAFGWEIEGDEPKPLSLIGDPETPHIDRADAME